MVTAATTVATTVVTAVDRPPSRGVAERRRPRGQASSIHYNTGRAWAFDTPFPYWKRWAGYDGGIVDLCLVS